MFLEITHLFVIDFQVARDWLDGREIQSSSTSDSERKMSNVHLTVF